MKLRRSCKGFHSTSAKEMPWPKAAWPLSTCGAVSRGWRRLRGRPATGQHPLRARRRRRHAEGGRAEGAVCFRGGCDGCCCGCGCGGGDGRLAERQQRELLKQLAPLPPRAGPRLLPPPLLSPRPRSSPRRPPCRHRRRRPAPASSQCPVHMDTG
jgi:hypothetical protein